MSAILLLGQLLETTGEICGRKKLQKIVHLLQNLKAVPFGYSFQFSFFGPYSADLKEDVSSLAREELVLETRSETELGNPYRFAAGEKMKRLLQDVAVASMEDWAPLAQDLNRRTAEELEGLSTVLFLQKIGWTGAELSEQFALLKPRLSQNFPQYLQGLEKLVA